jgi:hypothetical protein
MKIFKKTEEKLPAGTFDDYTNKNKQKKGKK